jgi:flagellin-specific chaperone FliS
MIAYRRYAQTQIETASRERIMISLIQAVSRNMKSAIEFFETGQATKAVPLLTRASDIVLYLARTLRPTPESQELCQTLSKIYLFVALKLTCSATGRDVKLVREAQRAFQPIADGFTVAVEKFNAEQPAPSKVA